MLALDKEESSTICLATIIANLIKGQVLIVEVVVSISDDFTKILVFF